MEQMNLSKDKGCYAWLRGLLRAGAVVGLALALIVCTGCPPRPPQRCTTNANCDDGRFCNGEETCGTNGVCQPGTPSCEADQQCDEVNDICVDVCDVDADCDDGLFCNGEETCGTNGVCQAGDDPCTADQECDEEADICQDVCQEDADCEEDDNPCTDAVCTGGFCGFENNTDPCDDANECTSDDVCADGECAGEANTDPCDDGDACTENDVCFSGECIGTSVECPEGEECFDGDCVRLLASYEPSEETDLTVSVNDAQDRTLTRTWPVPGGTEGVPAATQGDYVLKMEWTGETDGKVEVRHDWAHFTFDLAGYSEIRADVYVATDSALPGIVGIWDDVFGWIEGFPLPTNTSEWVTIHMSVEHLENTNLDHIFALLFEDLRGDDGSMYLDNLRLAGPVSPKQISFAGATWMVKSGIGLGPGPNHFSDSEENVWVDENGRLHLRIRNRDDMWYCSEIIADDSQGYGTYVFTVESRLDSLDENAVLGLFTWDTNAPEYNYREIDFEFGRWGDPANDNAQFVIQPWDTPGNQHRFNIGYSGPTETTTHVLTWQLDGICFTSYYGAFSLSPPTENIIERWLYTGDDNPPPGGENIRMNLWLMNGEPPDNGEDAEVVVTAFQYRTDMAAVPCE